MLKSLTPAAEWEAALKWEADSQSRALFRASSGHSGHSLAHLPWIPSSASVPFPFVMFLKWKLLDSVVLVSAVQQCESATVMRVSALPWASASPHHTPHSHRRPPGWAPGHRAPSRRLPVLHMGKCVYVNATPWVIFSKDFLPSLEKTVSMYLFTVFLCCPPYCKLCLLQNRHACFNHTVPPVPKPVLGTC